MLALTHEQKMALYRDGFVKIPGVIPQVMIDEALKTINASFGDRGIDPEELPAYRARTYCPEVTGAPEITGLISNTPAWSLIESLLGEGNVSKPKSAQIAVRFPSRIDPPPEPHPHLDGMYSPNNGVPEGTIQNFTMLVGVYLSEVNRPYAGNFTVWPGTHHIYEQYFREHGPEALLQGMPPVKLPEPVQLLVKPGDVVLAHYQLAHGSAINVAPHPRYALYFRFKHRNHDSDWKARMTDIWMDWPGMQSILASVAS